MYVTILTSVNLSDFLIKEEGSNSAESERSVATELELVAVDAVDTLLMELALATKDKGSTTTILLSKKHVVMSTIVLVEAVSGLYAKRLCNMRCPGWVLECNIAATKAPC
jgi:hypothetical protein